MLIQVTQSHIDRGVCANTSRCAVAEAILDHIKPSVAINVFCDKVCLLDQGADLYWCNLPLEDWIGDFIVDFDHDRALCKPFSFELDIPQRFLKPQPTAVIPSALMRRVACENVELAGCEVP